MGKKIEIVAAITKDEALGLVESHSHQVRFKSPNGGRQELIHDGKYFSVAIDFEERKANV